MANLASSPIAVAEFKLTPRQRDANYLMGTPARHIMFYGGVRSGKTFVIIRAIIVRALKEPDSRHIILRKAFNHVKTSVWLDTLPKVLKLCFPQLLKGTHFFENKSDWYIQFSNGSQIWIGGLDEKDRSEKILGQEYATIYLNEVSQISYSSVVMARTRLAQNTRLELKMYYDCNPVGREHWTYVNFVEKKNPETRKPLRNPDRYNYMQINPEHNIANLPEGVLEELEDLSSAKKQRFLKGEFQSNLDTALFSYDTFDSTRCDDFDLSLMLRVVVAVDPSGVRGAADFRSDLVGIVVCGIDEEGDVYCIEDASMRGTPTEWGARVVGLVDEYKADTVVGEINYGGAMVKHVVETADPNVPFIEVVATRGKVIRSEPVSMLFNKSRGNLKGGAHMVGAQDTIEDQLVGMTTAGYIGIKSPDNADAMIWGFTELKGLVPFNKAKRLGSLA